MDRLLEALDRLLVSARTPLDGRLSQALNPEVELGELERRLQQLRASRTVGDGGQPPALDVDALVLRWQRASPEISSFSRRELLALCWDVRGASDPLFIEGVERAGHFARHRFLRGLWHSHQQHWRIATASTVERLLQQAVSTFESAPRWLRAIGSDARMLTKAAVESLVSRLSSDWSVRLDPLVEAGVLPSGALGALALDTATTKWLTQVGNSRGQPSVEDLLGQGTSGLLAAENISPVRFHMAVEALLKDVQASPATYKDAMTQLILSDERLGHPMRVNSRGNWVGFSAAARKAAVQLFAARDLNAFFEVLIGRADDYQQRRRFWEQYVESPQLVDFAIACDPYDMSKLRSQLGARIGSVARLNGSPSSNSAFMMKFLTQGREIVIVEISQPNNSMYLFDGATFDSAVGSLERTSFNFRALKDQVNNLERLTHSAGSWHYRFQSRLAAYGVRPGAR